MTRDATYPVIVVDPRCVRDEEQMGSKEKRWIDLPDDPLPWLFKYSREHAGVFSGEHWSEKVAAEVAEMLGVEHARVELGVLDGQSGSLSRKFDALADPNAELVHGNDVLAGFLAGYDRDKKRRQSDHTLLNILAAVQRHIPRGAEREQALWQLGGYLVLDALILNTDRHHENWALLRVPRSSDRPTHAVAPSFDHASSLARNEPPDKLTSWLAQAWRPGWYAGRASGAIYRRHSDGHPANPIELVRYAFGRWPAYVEPWIARMRVLTHEEVAGVVRRVPDSMIARPSREFASALLSYTLTALQELDK